MIFSDDGQFNLFSAFGKGLPWPRVGSSSESGKRGGAPGNLGEPWLGAAGLAGNFVFRPSHPTKFLGVLGGGFSDEKYTFDVMLFWPRDINFWFPDIAGRVSGRGVRSCFRAPLFLYLFR